MAACPWCKAQVGDLLALTPCPRCGRRSNEQVAIPTGDDVPDLDIPARAPRAPKAAPAAKPPVSAPPLQPARSAPQPGPSSKHENKALGDPGARTFDDDDGDLSGGSLDLDLTGPPLIAGPTSAKLKAAAPAPQAPALPGSVANAAAASSTMASMASMTSMTSTAAEAKKQNGTEDVDPYEARALADYGDPPGAWWKTPLYAYRVLRRRPELKKLAAQKRREAERASGAAEDALFAFAEVVRPVAEPLGAYGAAFDAVRATERVFGERDAILASETAAHKQRQAEIDTRIAELEGGLAQVHAEERTIAAELAEADTLLKRAEARVKRIEIEMRAVVAQAGGPTGDGAKGPGP
jgi:hypothetical protein